MVQHNYTREQWQELDGGLKASCIAFSRLNRLVSMHQQDAVAKAQKRKQKK